MCAQLSHASAKHCILAWAEGMGGCRLARYLAECLDQVFSVEGVAPAELFRSKGRLGLGRMVAIELHTGELTENDQIKQRMVEKKTYADWNKALPEKDFLPADHINMLSKAVESSLIKLEFDLGYAIEVVVMVVEAMARTGKEPTFCMGLPLAFVAVQPHVFYDYFTQRFDMHLGRQGNLMAERPTHFVNFTSNDLLVRIDLHKNQLSAIQSSGLLTVELSLRYPSSRLAGALAALAHARAVLRRMRCASRGGLAGHNVYEGDFDQVAGAS